jgi:hypothetical protein
MKPSSSEAATRSYFGGTDIHTSCRAGKSRFAVIPANAGIQFKYDVRRTQNRFLSASHSVLGLDSGIRRNDDKPPSGAHEKLCRCLCGGGETKATRNKYRRPNSPNKRQPRSSRWPLGHPASKRFEMFAITLATQFAASHPFSTVQHPQQGV